MADTTTGATVAPTPKPARVPAGPAPTSALTQQHRKLYWPLVAPALAVYLLLFVGPALSGIWISFQSWRGSGDQMKYVGTRNYERLWNDTAFTTAFWNSLKILVICGVVIFALAFVISALLRGMRFRRGLQALLFLPYIISPIAIGVGLGLLLDPNGIVNAGLRGVGLSSLARPWLSPDRLFTTILVGVIWVTTGFYVMLLMAGADRIPGYFYEDSQLAGANKLQQWWYVTLPLSWDVIAISAVLWVINALKIFEFIYAFTGTTDAPPEQARTVPIYQFIMTMGGRSPAYEMGYGCAMGVVMVALIVVLVVLIRRVMRREAVTF
ncbi:sugar ABC transporter permease [Spongiactinospora rosea]|uniref:Sugar ABC transporter permease n=1 Tax=Spongiactinospora rosea TaxID=2248750 RepID=A0A366LXP3_9ACTN|nr:sugar ABC transporter permease [Spongiactinospora rosea]RBQ18323.1 sugar ABC transporter permease [Spongiactinospora rosea]